MLQRCQCFASICLIAIFSVFLPVVDLAVAPAWAMSVQSPASQESIAVSGTIRRIGVAGSCYQLIASDGSKYELMGEFPQQDGLKVKVNGVLRSDVMTICQVGKLLQVSKVRVLDRP
jgi:hypothetical protein